MTPQAKNSQLQTSVSILHAVSISLQHGLGFFAVVWPFKSDAIQHWFGLDDLLSGFFLASFLIVSTLAVLLLIDAIRLIIGRRLKGIPISRWIYRYQLTVFTHLGGAIAVLASIHFDPDSLFFMIPHCLLMIYATANSLAVRTQRQQATAAISRQNSRIEPPPADT